MRPHPATADLRDAIGNARAADAHHPGDPAHARPGPDTMDAIGAIDMAVARLIADGAAAAALARAVIRQPDADPSARALAHALCALFEWREGDVTQGGRHLAAADALASAAALSPRAGDLIGHARAQWHRREGRLPEAEALLRALHQRADQRPCADAYLTAASLGTVLSMRGDDDGALDLYYQGLALARRSGQDSLLVNALNNLGSYQSDLHNLEDAVPLLEECLAGALRLGSRRQTIYAAGNLVQCLCLAGEPVRALALAREHLVGRIHADDPPALQRDEEIALALLDNGLVEAAEAALGDEAHADPLSNELATARVWLLARIALSRGQADAALQRCLSHLERLNNGGEEGTLPIDRVNLLRAAAQAAHAVADHALAYRLLHQAFATHEQLLGRAARSRQLSLQIAHRLSQAEGERDTARQLAAGLATLNASLQAQVAENERLQARLRAQALEDPLTGLYNRRHLMGAGPDLLALVRRRAAPLALALFDLDHFKQVNDHHGHDAGDRVLRAFADLLQQNLRAEDLACRYGGEEFVLLLPGATAPQAVARLRALLVQWQALRFPGAAGEHFASSFSAGVVDSANGQQPLPVLLTAADAALYEAKAAGRAQVVVASAIPA